MVDLPIVFSVVVAILSIGFLGNIFFKKTGWPDILFLIAVGIVIGPFLNIFSKDVFIQSLPAISTFTLLMILFRGGMELNISEVLSKGFRALFQASAYFLLGMIWTAISLHFAMGWEWIDSFMLGSIVSQTGAVVIIPLAKGIGVQEGSATLLSIEATATSIYNIVFFFAFLETRLGGTLNFTEALTLIMAKISVGVIIGVFVGIAFLRILFLLEKEEFTYMVTLGIILLSYVISEELKGSGALTVLILGIILGNNEEMFRILGRDHHPLYLSEVKRRLENFQAEISFILRTFFFVLLGLVFDISQPSLFRALAYVLPITGILLASRFLVTSASTWKSPMFSDREIITGMCGLGLTPALLSLIPLQYNLPNSNLYPVIITNLIILTNIITSISAFKYRRKPKKGVYQRSLPPPHFKRPSKALTILHKPSLSRRCSQHTPSWSQGNKENGEDANLSSCSPCRTGYASSPQRP
jgi:cell volume regulation protein A